MVAISDRLCNQIKALMPGQGSALVKGALHCVEHTVLHVDRRAPEDEIHTVLLASKVSKQFACNPLVACLHTGNAAVLTDKHGKFRRAFEELQKFEPKI